MSPKRWNIVWLLVDSVRAYSGAGDDRDKLQFMYEFQKESVEFSKVITSAPSTIMAITSMLTGMPAYFIAKSYNEFQIDHTDFLSLGAILEKKFYNVFGLFRHPSSREKFLKIINQPRKNMWPNNLSHSAWWSNKDINMLARKVVKRVSLQNNNPFFLFLHYNCRLDKSISQVVKEQYCWFIKNGLNHENTIFILCSDHGYPDPSRGHNPESFARNKMTHDMLLTNDNIMIPFYISYPGGPKGKIIDSTISSLDFLPTILRLLGINDYKVSNFEYGKDLVHLIDGYPFKHDKRLVRTDARLLYQNNKITAITNGKFKYIYYHGKRNLDSYEEFYDISRDSFEEKNIICDASYLKVINFFRKEFETSEQNAINSHIHFLEKKLDQLISKELSVRKQKMISVAIASNAKREFSLTIFNLLKRYSFLSKIDILEHPGQEKYSILFLAIEKRTDYKSQEFIEKFKGIGKRIIIIDYNLNDSRIKNYFMARILSLNNKWQFVKDEPLVFVREIFNIIFLTYDHFKNKFSEPNCK